MLKKNIFHSLKVVVIGDIVLDHFIYGTSSRISPEAPVPIVNVQSESYRLGGAANVANNVRKLGADCLLFGSISNDISGKHILSICKKNKIKTNFKVIKKSKTTLKSRIFINNHQIARLDNEETRDLNIINNNLYLKKIEKSIKNSDIVIVSDYCKGFLSDILAKKIVKFAKTNKKIIIVDSKKLNWKCFKNVDYMTPNVDELGKISNQNLKNQKQEIIKAATKIINKYGIKNIVVTRSGKGASIISKLDSIFNSNKRISVFDVTGAGDSFVSAFALMKAQGFSDLESLKISTIVGSIAVSKAGTCSVRVSEIINFLNKNEK